MSILAKYPLGYVIRGKSYAIELDTRTTGIGDRTVSSKLSFTGKRRESLPHRKWK